VSTLHYSFPDPNGVTQISIGHRPMKNSYTSWSPERARHKRYIEFTYNFTFPKQLVLQHWI